MTPFRQIFNLTFSPDKKFVVSLKNLLGFTPKNLSVYHLAFRHSSVSGEVDANNERLEFLGDAVLSVIVAEYVFLKFPYKPEGFLTEMRSKMVSRTSLNSIAKKIGLDEFIKYNKSDRKINKSGISGNAFEALVGAIYLDRGFDATKKFIHTKIIQLHLDLEELEAREVNFKSRLLERSQRMGKKVEFRLKEENIVNHRKFFTMAVFVEGQEMGVGQDFNKKNAEQKAAEKAMQQFEELKT